MRAIADALDLSELISDCADLPLAVFQPGAAVPTQLDPGDWYISDECLAQIAGIGDYGS